MSFLGESTGHWQITLTKGNDVESVPRWYHREYSRETWTKVNAEAIKQGMLSHKSFN